MNLILRAAHFAAEAHKDQRRKYTDEPYINHPIEVAKNVSSVPHDEYMLAAALLHDVVEDTQVTDADLRRAFGDLIANYVEQLTDNEVGNRKTRKALARERLSKAHPNAQTIKLADLISNTSSIKQHDPDFAVVYLREKRELLEVMRDGDRKLWEHAWSLL